MYAAEGGAARLRAEAATTTPPRSRPHTSPLSVQLDCNDGAAAQRHAPFHSPVSRTIPSIHYRACYSPLVDDVEAVKVVGEAHKVLHVGHLRVHVCRHEYARQVLDVKSPRRRRVLVVMRAFA